MFQKINSRKIFLLLMTLFSYCQISASFTMIEHGARTILRKDLSIADPFLMVGAAIGSEFGAYKIDQFNEPRINKYLNKNFTIKLQHFLTRCCEYYSAQSIVNTLLIPYQMTFVLKRLSLQNVLIEGGCDFIREQDYEKNDRIFSSNGNEKFLRPMLSMIGNVEYQIGRAYLDTYTFKKFDWLSKLVCAAISYSVGGTIVNQYWHPVREKIYKKIKKYKFRDNFELCAFLVVHLLDVSIYQGFYFLINLSLFLLIQKSFGKSVIS